MCSKVKYLFRSFELWKFKDTKKFTDAEYNFNQYNGKKITRDHISLGFYINQSHPVKEHRQGKAVMSAQL